MAKTARELIVELDEYKAYAMPVAEGWSDGGPAREKGIPIVTALVEEARAHVASGDTADERSLAYLLNVHEALALVRGETAPAADVLARAATFLEAAYAITQRPPLGGELFDQQLRIWTGARKRAWDLLAAGPPYMEELRTRVGTITAYSDWCLGWPLAPITRDAKFRAFVEERIAAKKFDPPTKPPIYPMVEVITKLDQPVDDDEQLGRFLMLVWAGGMDQVAFDELVRRMTELEPKAPAWVLERLGTLGFKSKKLAKKANPEFEAKLRAAVDGIDARANEFIASCFNARERDVAKVIETVIAARPGNAKDVIDGLAGHPHVAWVALAALRAAGLAKDVTKSKTVRGGRLVVSGDCVVEGDLADATIVVGGNLTVKGTLTAPYDCVVGGTLKAKRVVADGSEGVLCVVGAIEGELVVTGDHDVETLGGVVAAATTTTATATPTPAEPAATDTTTPAAPPAAVEAAKPAAAKPAAAKPAAAKPAAKAKAATKKPAAKATKKPAAKTTKKPAAKATKKPAAKATKKPAAKKR